MLSVCVSTIFVKIVFIVWWGSKEIQVILLGAWHQVGARN